MGAKRCLTTIGLIVAVAALTSSRQAAAVVPTKVITETTEFVVRKFVKEATEEGTEAIAKQATTIAAKYGDEGLNVLRKTGPRGFKVVQEAGEHGLDAVKLINRYGDDAVWVISKPKGMAIFVKYGDDAARALIKHKGIAEEVIETHGKSAVNALNAVGSRQARQIAMLDKDGVIAAGKQGDELLDVIGRYGDKAMAFIWRNKGGLAVVAVLGTFLTDPEAYINGAKELVVEGVSRPASEMGKEMARHTNWTVIGLLAIGVLAGLQGLRMWLKRPKQAATPAP